ncbi:unnamed protein product [Effrenium voratum]|nr:unnamed protein product [Effrenium voratum]
MRGLPGAGGHGLRRTRGPLRAEDERWQYLHSCGGQHLRQPGVLRLQAELQADPGAGPYPLWRAGGGGADLPQAPGGRRAVEAWGAGGSADGAVGGGQKLRGGDLGGGFEFRDLARHSVKVNVFHSINFMLRCSSPLRELVKSGGLEIHGGIYHLETGRVEFLGQSPQQAELLLSHSPSVPQVHTSEAPILAPPALERLWAGNQRYLGGIHRSGSCDRKALVESQAPHTAIVGCADARTPFELLFDAMPGDIFTLRNAGNACTRAEGSMLGSLEFCAGLGTQLILVLGHSNCRALKSAAQVRHEGAADESPVDALLASLSVVCREAEKRLGPVSEEEVLKLATELNVLRSMDFLLKYSRLVRERVRKGELEVHGAICDETGAVRFLGCSPQQQSLLECDAALDKVLGA